MTNLKGFYWRSSKLTPREYKARFVNVSQTADETYTLFRARLHNLLLYYIRSRQAEDDYECLINILVSDRLTEFRARLHNLLLYYIRSRQVEGDYECLINILVSDSLKECLSASALNYVMNLEGDAFFEPDRVSMLADTYDNNYQDGKYNGNQITELNAEPKDNKCKKGIWHNKGKVQTEGVVAKDAYSTSYRSKVTVDRKVGARLCCSCQSPNHMLKDCPSKAKTKPYQVKACMPLVQVTTECAQCGQNSSQQW